MIESVAIVLYLISFCILISSIFFSSEDANAIGLGMPELPSKHDLDNLLNRANVNKNYNIGNLFEDFIAGLKLLIVIITGEDLKYIINVVTNYEIIGYFVQGIYIISTLFLAFKIITGRFI